MRSFCLPIKMGNLKIVWKIDHDLILIMFILLTFLFLFLYLVNIFPSNSCRSSFESMLSLNKDECILDYIDRYDDFWNACKFKQDDQGDRREKWYEKSKNNRKSIFDIDRINRKRSPVDGYLQYTRIYNII